MVLSERHGLIVSVGQVVPHEVTGMANYNKNLFVGVGGVDAINLSHFIGAVYGMERMMGRADNPLREILEYASVEFLGGLPLFYVLTVMGKGEDGELEVRINKKYTHTQHTTHARALRARTDKPPPQRTPTP